MTYYQSEAELKALAHEALAAFREIAKAAKRPEHPDERGGPIEYYLDRADAELALGLWTAAYSAEDRRRPIEKRTSDVKNALEKFKQRRKGQNKNAGDQTEDGGGHNDPFQKGTGARPD